MTRLILGRGRSGREKCVYTGLQASRGLSVCSRGSDKVCFFEVGKNLYESVSYSGLWPGMDKVGSVMLLTFKSERKNRENKYKILKFNPLTSGRIIIKYIKVSV